MLDTGYKIVNKVSTPIGFHYNGRVQAINNEVDEHKLLQLLYYGKTSHLEEDGQ